MINDEDIMFEGDVQLFPTMKTGFLLMDHSLATGIPPVDSIPLNMMWEIYGAPGVGKTNFCLLIAGLVAKGRTISFGSFEGYDPSLMKAVLNSIDFKGKVKIVEKEETETTLETLLTDLLNEDVGAIIVDSLGAITTLKEQSSKLDERDIGSRAFTVGKFSKRAMCTFKNRKTPNILLATNHVHQLIGGMASTTSGGVTKDYASRVRIRLSHKETFDDGSWHIAGKPEKLTFGKKKQEFNLIFLSDFGFHRGLTTVVDAISLGVAKEDRVIKLDGVSMGYFSSLIKKARAGENDIFTLFEDAVKKELEDRKL